MFSLESPIILRLFRKRKGRKDHQDRKEIIFYVILVIALSACTERGSNQSRESPSELTQNSLSFTDVTAQANLSDFRHETGAFGRKWFPESMGAGGGFIDYNGDDYQDIVLIGGGTWPEYTGETVPVLWLFRNNGDGTFTEVTEEAGLSDVRTYAFGITVGDYDNDGDDDFFLTTLYENMLFRNDGGRFVEVGKEAGIAGRSEYTSTAIFFDADRDGYLDLYVGNYARWTPENDIFCTIDGRTKSYCRPDLYESIPGRYYHNNGDGTFDDKTEQAGFLYPPKETPGNALSIIQFDYNEDGWLDLAISNDNQRNLLYENDGEGTFTERGIVSGIAFDDNGSPRSSMGMDAGDVDNDGQLSIFVGTFTGEMMGVFQHLGNGLFMDRAAVLKVARPTLPYVNMGLFLFDVDLDGDLDMFICNGHIHHNIEEVQEGITYLQRSQLFINRGSGVFEDVSEEMGGVLTVPLAGRGAAYADYDLDGDLDILVTEADGPAHLWRNDLQEGNALRITLRGRESNFDGIGTKLHAYVNGERIVRWVRVGGSYLSHSEYPATIGLGEATSVDSLQVFWISGRKDQYKNIPANRHIYITEGENEYTVKRMLR